MTAFRQKIFNIVKRIPTGKTLTYKEVAQLAGSHRAYRAVGNIMHTNYDPAIPCHRVVRSDGKLGGYNRGVKKKRELLTEEKGCPKGGVEVLSRSFFDGSVLKIAPDLLGKFLVRRWHGKIIAGMITEVEAYDGPQDLACHASKGKTARTEPLFGEAGYWYVYLVYGMHWMLNIVTGPKDYPAAVLIRGTDVIQNPGRLTNYFHIDKQYNTKMAAPNTGLWIEDRGVKISPKKIVKTPRIGVEYAKEWANKPYRFIIK